MTTIDDDPRLHSRYVETIAGTVEQAPVTLVGVVHDHPASVYRVRNVVAAASPAVLALELPPLAVPLYEQYGTATSTPPPDGGEFSAAIQAAEGATVVGIDGPSLGFARKLAHRLVRERASTTTVSKSLRNLCAITRTAIACRLAGTAPSFAPLARPKSTSPDYEVAHSDPPDIQAEDERRHIRAATAVLDAFETAPSSQYRSETRERHMADRLTSLRDREAVVAIVGAGHFDPLCDRLRNRDSDE